MSDAPKQDNRAIVDRQVAAIAKYLKENVWNKKPKPQIPTTANAHATPSEISSSKDGKSDSA